MTVCDFLAALQVRGVQLSRKGGRLLVDAPAGALTAADRKLLATHKEELLAVADFRADLAILVLWFRHARAAGRLPDDPFALAPWQQVTHPARFYAALELDIATGPRGARARLGGLASCLRRLRTVLEARGQEERPPDSRTHTEPGRGLHATAPR
jgi:hypothetical protein